MKRISINIFLGLILIFLLQGCIVWFFKGFNQGTGRIGDYYTFQCTEEKLHESIKAFLNENPEHKIPSNFNQNLLIHGYLDTLSPESKEFNANEYHFYLKNDTLAFWASIVKPIEELGSNSSKMSLKGISKNGGSFKTIENFSRKEKKYELPKIVKKFEREVIKPLKIKCSVSVN